MKIKVFHIRLTRDNLYTDQDVLNDFLNGVIVKKTAVELIVGQPNFWSILIFYEDKKPENIDENQKSNKVSPITETILTEDDKTMLAALKQWRHDKSVQLNTPSFVICNNESLIQISALRPKSLEDLLKIKGFGEQKVAKFGNEILAIVNPDQPILS